MSNRLAGSTSPYLLQHQNNPVDWYRWCDEALKKAVQEDKPIFLSIGYSACHWCHVMEHESFENPHIASILNEHFISIKVDREQRPDLDQIYMQVVQMLTGSGGWPMSIFLTPSTKPFYGGTYWPPENRWGRPGFAQVLNSVTDAWKNQREAIHAQSEEWVGHLHKSIGALSQSTRQTLTSETSDSILSNADTSLFEAFDSKYGGFGSAPKFPHASDLRFWIRREEVDPNPSRRQAITKTLDCMAAGGIYDHLGGGFARYSVDERWLVPHFEKMLYDNALLISVYLDGYRLTKNSDYLEIARETLEYILRDMTDSLGGFYSAEDADSQGAEGRFYVWSQAEIFQVLEEEAAHFFSEAYGVKPAGNFEGHSILHLLQPIADLSKRHGIPISEVKQKLADSRLKLLAARSLRVRPLRDDKILVSWNALMITAMSEAGVVLGEPRYLMAAQRCADFLIEHLRDADGNWLHVWRNGQAEIGAFLDDYSYLAVAMIQLWECDGESRWLAEAIQLVDTLVARFSVPEGGGFFFTADTAEQLITRTKDGQDGSVPSGNSMAACAMIRLAHWTERDDYHLQSQSSLETSVELMQRSPMAAGQWLFALDDAMCRNETWVILLRERTNESSSLRTKLKLLLDSGTKVLIARYDHQGTHKNAIHPAISAWLENRTLAEDQDAVLFRCEGSTCEMPIFGIENIVEKARTR